MARPIAGNWKSLPGNFDPLHALDKQPGSGAWDVPMLPLVDPIDVPTFFIAYDDWIPMHRKGHLPDDAGIHFFTDDYRFESCWNNPERALTRMPNCMAVCSPDFSLYRDWPLAIQLWNVYRNRLLGALWAKKMTVIPTIGWSDKRSYSFCFDGVPNYSVVAISTIGTQGADKEAKRLFIAGYEAMLSRLTPSCVMVHGEKAPAEVLRHSVEVRQIPAWQTEMRKRVEANKKQKVSSQADQ